MRHPSILDRTGTALLIIDIQEKIFALMQHRERVLERAVTLIQGFNTLEVPIFITEQYPKGLGPTEQKIAEALSGVTAVQKMTFSCCGEPDVLRKLRESKVQQVVVCGIECHVCVLQTVLDLLGTDFQVHVVVDAVSSRETLNCETALRRMQAAGAILTTTETVLFELLEKCGTDEFKQVVKLVK